VVGAFRWSSSPRGTSGRIETTGGRWLRSLISDTWFARRRGCGASRRPRPAHGGLGSTPVVAAPETSSAGSIPLWTGLLSVSACRWHVVASHPRGRTRAGRRGPVASCQYLRVGQVVASFEFLRQPLSAAIGNLPETVTRLGPLAAMEAARLRPPAVSGACVEDGGAPFRGALTRLASATSR
jgi:hypothetical protein